MAKCRRRVKRIPGLIIICLGLLTCFMFLKSSSVNTITVTVPRNKTSLDLLGLNSECKTVQQSPRVRQDDNPLNIFYFGVTHHKNRAKLLACENTWVKTLPNMHWYSDKPDPEVNVTVVSFEGGNQYALIPFRTLMIFHHVIEHHKGYDWYVRLWDDTYVDRERLERLLNKQDPNDPVLIGKVIGYSLSGYRLYDDHGSYTMKPFTYVAGGPGWVLSKAAFNIWALNHEQKTLTHKSCLMGGLLEYTKYIGPYYTAEDLIFSQCLLTQGVAFVHALGFENWDITHNEVNMSVQEVMNGKCASYERPERIDESLFWCGLVKCINIPNCLGIITLHYVQPGRMVELHMLSIVTKDKDLARRANI